MVVHRRLALCVGLACTALAWASSAAPSDRDAALAEIGRYRDQARWLDALGAIERANQQQPNDDLLFKLRVLTLGDIGNAWRAWELYQQRPQLFDDAQKQRLEGDYLAKLVVWSLAYSSSEDSRLEEAESTLARMQRYIGGEGTPPSQAPLRIRMDRLILLNRLGRHAQVREEARALQAEGHTLPDYVLPAVGDSLMGTLHPEEAIPVLQAAVAGDPARDASHSELAYAYLESEQQEKAIDLLQAWRDKEPAWRWSNGKSPYANWSRYEADLNLAMVRAYSGDLVTAQHDLESMVDIAPGNGGLQSALGSVYMMRGWPRRALQRQQMAHALDPRDIEPRLGMEEAYVALQRDDLARPLHDDLVARYPTQPAVERMDQAWRAHRGWQLKAWTDIGRSSGGGGTSPLGNNDRHYGVEVETPILDDRWRLFALADRRSTDFQDQRIDPLWLGAGVRYRFGQLDAEAAVLRANDHISDTGLRVGVGWQFNDYWHAGLVAARNDPDASMQARAAGITADSVSAQVDYRRSELTHWMLGASRFRYDDGNHRELFSTSIEQRLLTRPRWLLDGLASAYTSRGSRDDAPYFNPKRDRMVEIGLRIDQQLWRHYERHFRHRLTVSLGDYWQDGFGSALVPTVSYMHEWQLGPGRVLEYGVRWSRPVYDGHRERHIGFEAALRWGD
ncbi:poly-beta-1,6 N-acetyl-D-glucosamine export porin PgaA [Stenotrophomonas maltophilia]|uniref:poly-beta-1,6 N-acetyl-D-glucosamine export porin PgaA n=1 Tax=Stenotrophomonas TaxID=40323 RepID=UPI0006AC7047|nr:MULTISPECIES: poly-beta-1,6 N-acetyl-D-glucosamine export porin PgaA [Stenotrophomonas]KOQ62421.1 hemin storage protein [Stenotrophomonas maltophilia]MBN7831505.1 poly-beta-1,6 N-acetyl-D-glucosamine export porin PgaA [Stenotrophomonas maltophilia]MBN7833144.1 poly-beta-1,6 N-acetyl-D-glucosamine export porin PgaA [Stenotrophomonas maltophilia]MBN7857403.1 poly-beta-1,6 N-acetyl-D-glucosamine export porin PgaA [Stenotrophomonas maltophilia]MBN7918719.1 poly-beta-1,6 N-acetyl-D-glucosamine e